MEIIDRMFLGVTTQTCHASTMTFYKNAPVFAWFGGEREGYPDSSIYIQYKGKIKTIGTNKHIAYWNPILFKIKNELFLAYKIGDFCDRWQTYIVNITDIDDVDTFSKSKHYIIPAGLNFAVKTKPIIDKGGLIHCGSSVETQSDWTSYIESYRYNGSEFIFKNRSRPLIVPKQSFSYNRPNYGRITSLSMGIIQPSLWLDSRDKLHAMFRSSRGLYHIYYSKQDEFGEWDQPRTLIFRNPNSGIDTVCIDGRLFLVYNPSCKKRFPLIVSEITQSDDGGTMEVIDTIVVRREVEGNVLTSELSYPYMVEQEGCLHLVYTHGRTNIEYVVIKL